MKIDKCIFFDTETNGIGGFRPPKHRLLQLGYITPDEEKKIYIKGVTKIASGLPHDITIKKCNEEGIDSKDALSKFIEEVKKVDIIIAHNIEFDIGIVRHILKEDGHAELLNEFNKVISKKLKVCTMHSTKNFCKLEFKDTQKYQSRSDYKWPSLSELYTKLYLEPPSEKLHDALEDCRVLKKCVVKLEEVGQFITS